MTKNRSNYRNKKSSNNCNKINWRSVQKKNRYKSRYFCQNAWKNWQNMNWQKIKRYHLMDWINQYVYRLFENNILYNNKPEKKSVIKCQYLRCKTKTTAEYIGFVVAIKWFQFYSAVCVVVSITIIASCILPFRYAKQTRTYSWLKILSNYFFLIQNQSKFMLFYLI